MESEYRSLRVEALDGVVHITFDHPPINLLDATMIGDLDRLSHALAADASVRVVVFRSANPDFFIAHADVEMIQQLPAELPPRSDELSFVHAIYDRIQHLPAATIGQLEGRARGGGSELLLALDMRFAAIGHAWLSQPEVAIGIIPGAGGTQRLPQLVGRGRGLEAVLGAEDFDAELAERYGWINRALPAASLEPFVDRLARRIASFPPEAVRLAKQAVDAALHAPRDGLLDEWHLFTQALAAPEARPRMAAFLEAGGQTPEVERGVAFGPDAGRRREP